MRGCRRSGERARLADIEHSYWFNDEAVISDQMMESVYEGDMLLAGYTKEGDLLRGPPGG